MKYNLLWSGVQGSCTVLFSELNLGAWAEELSPQCGILWFARSLGPHIQVMIHHTVGIVVYAVNMNMMYTVGTVIYQKLP